MKKISVNVVCTPIYNTVDPLKCDNHLQCCDEVDKKPFKLECSEWREVRRAEPSRGKREEGRREGGTEGPSLLARRSGR